MKQLFKIFLNLKIRTNGKYNNNSKRKIRELNKIFLKETIKLNKVAFYYENINNKNVLSFNSNITFYAASSIKMLVCLYLFKEASKKKINLNEKLLITKNDIKYGSGVIKNITEDTEFTILELIKYSLIESDDTAYVKLMNYVGKETIHKFGRKLGAKHTMDGIESDCFGIISCDDMIIYWKEIKKFIDKDKKYGKIFKDYLLNPSVKFIMDENVNYKKFVRKYGEHGVAYHEAGYIDSKNPYYLIILTQLNELDYKEEFINKVAKIISEIHKENM